MKSSSHCTHFRGLLPGGLAGDTKCPPEPRKRPPEAAGVSPRVRRHTRCRRTLANGYHAPHRESRRVMPHRDITKITIGRIYVDMPIVGVYIYKICTAIRTRCTVSRASESELGRRDDHTPEKARSEFAPAGVLHSAHTACVFWIRRLGPRHVHRDCCIRSVSYAAEFDGFSCRRGSIFLVCLHDSLASPTY